MRHSILALAAVLVGAACLYAASPFYTAWSIREAVKSGDADFLRDTIEWTPVRKTLRDSMLAMTLGRPEAVVDVPEPRGGLWASFKSYMSRNVVDGMVERYATPEGLPTLFAHGQTVRRNVLMQEDPEEKMALPEKIAFIWSRVTRAEFTGLTRFEMEMADKHEPTRLFAGVLEFKGAGSGLGWKLTELRVRERTAAGVALPLLETATQ
ncbi:MAG: DUF2939 domain-containing protein [Hyphomicrobiaceae bacterium]|nr:DUF2939 domain-containing protein [Hyphomicrobiaceae bacterium]